ncbi:hypothetical protein IEQ34_017209 [Dendrobium chrysotoxum]|uniref:FAD-binding domain-containing protein n=1 Tax=Dendrobium chrysotoxum TaxID=161865 RepID=A0AAV7GAV9_DENCH|nr:hypothetical protein IEQ34_017209 [Dendrobium chrysotoxum]
MAAKFQPLRLCLSYPNSNHMAMFQTPFSFPWIKRGPALSSSKKSIKCATLRCSKRTGKRRYPSEKKKLERINKTLTQTEIKIKEEGFWRFSKLAIPVHKDPGKDFFGVSLPLLESISKALEFPVASMLPMEAFTVVRKSFDARKLLKEPQFVYTVDMDVKKLLNLEPRAWDFISRLEPKLGSIEYMPSRKVLADLISILHNLVDNQHGTKQEEARDGIHNKSFNRSLFSKRPKVAVVGSGPSGLFASLVLSELGADVTLIERGQAVEQRGHDIGALVVRRALQPESNFCFGEGGAGTWSDGKLVTRIGRNSDSVLTVMKTLVHFGAPPEILLDGKPHLGTDRLIGILRNFRQHLVQLGVDIKFGTRLNDLIVENKQIIGIKVSNARDESRSNSQSLSYDAVVLAVGHSARDVYQMLLQHNVDMVPKDFAVGLRIEHPQELINKIQYSSLAAEVQLGRGKVPVADYKVVKYVNEGDEIVNSCLEDRSRSCYSFCMCPGGQVVLTSTNSSELCINGMSFSRRSSRWANAAIVVTVSTNDFAPFSGHGPLCGVEFQRHYERKAAMVGGGNFVVPAQTVTDFLDNKLSVTSLPQSSYRLGVRPSNLHELLPTHITKALQHSIAVFDKELPGYICKDALLHGVETRTSSPIRIVRNTDSYESTSVIGLYPVGEGAGHAGGIISAAVDGIYCGFALAKNLNLFEGDIESILGKAQKNTGFVKY